MEPKKSIPAAFIVKFADSCRPGAPPSELTVLFRGPGRYYECLRLSVDVTRALRSARGLSRAGFLLARTPAIEVPVTETGFNAASGRVHDGS